MLRIVNACFRKIMVPTRGQACLQPLKQHPAVVHLLNNLEPLGDDPIALAVGIQTMDCFLHLALQTGNAGQALKVVDHIKNQRGCGIPSS